MYGSNLLKGKKSGRSDVGEDNGSTCGTGWSACGNEVKSLVGN